MRIFLCRRGVVVGLAAAVLTSGLLVAQGGPSGVTVQELLDGYKNPSRWVTFSGDYSGQRHSPLKQITPQNAHRLAAQWTFQTGVIPRRGFEGTPLVADGVVYVTGAFNNAWALDAQTGRPFWRYQRELPTDLTYGAISPVNRGFGILGTRLFMLTADAHLVALDARTGNVLWDSVMADYKIGYAATGAPLVVKDKVIVGISGGDFPTRGFIDAYDPATGKRIWRFWTVPGPGEPGSETWPGTEVMARGGAATWVTGSYDPESNTVYWGTGNPNPLYYGDDRKGIQSLLRVDRGARRRHRHAEMDVPVHAPRHARLGLEPRAGAGRSDDRRPAAQSRDGRQPQRVLLRVRSHHREAARRQAVQRHDLGEGARRRTATRSSSTTAARAASPTSGGAPTTCRRRSIPC